MVFMDALLWTRLSSVSFAMPITLASLKWSLSICTQRHASRCPKWNVSLHQVHFPFVSMELHRRVRFQASADHVLYMCTWTGSMHVFACQIWAEDDECVAIRSPFTAQLHVDWCNSEFHNLWNFLYCPAIRGYRIAWWELYNKLAACDWNTIASSRSLKNVPKLNECALYESNFM